MAHVAGREQRAGRDLHHGAPAGFEVVQDVLEPSEVRVARSWLFLKSGIDPVAVVFIRLSERVGSGVVRHAEDGGRCRPAYAMDPDLHGSRPFP